MDPCLGCLVYHGGDARPRSLPRLLLEGWHTCSLHIDDKPRTAMSDITVSGNVFTADSTIRGCAAVVTHTVELTWSGNT